MIHYGAFWGKDFKYLSYVYGVSKNLSRGSLIGVHVKDVIPSIDQKETYKSTTSKWAQ